jgi:hypothetical protein
VPAFRHAPAERWLAAICRRDPDHAVDDVWTVYFDTADRLSLREKLDSDYLKTKIRVRAYAEPGLAPTGDAFIEMKRRVGDRREKVRVRLPGAAAALASRRLDDEAWRELPLALASEGVILGALWRPVLTLVYRRTRLVDPITGARVSSDREVRATAVHPAVRAAWSPEPLPVGVIEIKGPGGELPLSLRPLVRFGARRASFSKYAAIWAHVQRHSA